MTKSIFFENEEITSEEIMEMRRRVSCEELKELCGGQESITPHAYDLIDKYILSERAVKHKIADTNFQVFFGDVIALFEERHIEGTLFTLMLDHEDKIQTLLGMLCHRMTELEESGCFVVADMIMSF